MNRNKNYDVLRKIFTSKEQMYPALATMIGAAAEMTRYIDSVRDFIEVPKEIIYQMGLTIPFIMSVVEPEMFRDFEFTYRDITEEGFDDRYRLVIRNLIEMAEHWDKKMGKV